MFRLYEQPKTNELKTYFFFVILIDMSTLKFLDNFLRILYTFL